MRDRKAGLGCEIPARWATRVKVSEVLRYEKGDSPADNSLFPDFSNDEIWKRIPRPIPISFDGSKFYPIRLIRLKIHTQNL